MKIVEMTTKDLEHYISSVNKVLSGFERTDSNFETSSSVDKMLPNSIAGYKKNRERKSQSMQQPLLLSYFKKRPQQPTH